MRRDKKRREEKRREKSVESGDRSNCLRFLLSDGVHLCASIKIVRVSYLAINNLVVMGNWVYESIYIYIYIYIYI